MLIVSEVTSFNVLSDRRRELDGKYTVSDLRAILFECKAGLGRFNLRENEDSFYLIGLPIVRRVKSKITTTPKSSIR